MNDEQAAHLWYCLMVLGIVAFVWWSIASERGEK